MNLEGFTVIPDKNKDKFIDSIVILSEYSKILSEFYKAREGSVSKQNFYDERTRQKVLGAIEVAKDYLTFPKVNEMLKQIEEGYNLGN